jgi:hypothetical protein
MGRYEDLMKLVGKHGAKVAEEVGTYGKRALKGVEGAADYLDRPGAVVRSGIQAYQQDRPVIDSMVNQLSRSSSEAPTGDDLVEPMAAAEGYANPAKYAALAALAEVGSDPLNFVGGALEKGALKLGAKAANAFKVKKGLSAAEVLRDAKAAGKVAVMEGSELVSPMKKIPKDLKPSKTLDVADVRPEVKDINRFPDIKEQFPRTAETIDKMQGLNVSKPTLAPDEFDDVMDQFPQAAEAIRRLRGIK